MSFAYLPLFTGDYLRDTRHLTPLKHGVFLLALMHCWDSKGPMPLDEQECAGICNCRSADEVEAMRYILGRFFVRMEDGHYNQRMQREVERSEQISGARSEAGRKGYEARAKHLQSKSDASAKQVHLSPSPSPSPSEVTPTPDGFDDFWASWPKTDRKQDKKKCSEAWKKKRLSSSKAEIIAHVEASKQTRKWRDGYEPSPLTYLNGERWRDGMPETSGDSILAGDV